MKSVKFGVIITCLIGLLGLFSKCTKDTEINYTTFILTVDSIQVSDTIFANSQFDINFYGPESSSCTEFTHFNVEKLDNEVLIEPWGRNLISENSCDVLFTITGEKLTYSINESGEYLIKIIQKDNSFLEYSIIVE